LKCPNINKIKEFAIPTKDWLVPIEKLLIEKDINTKGRIYIANLMNKGQIIVKITNERKDRNTINENLSNFPNIVKTFCTFSCKDDFLLIEKNNQFCNTTDSKNNRKFTLELMEKYPRSLSAKKISIDVYKVALLELIFAQFNIFSKFGYTHNDIHSGNVLSKVTKEKNTFRYKYFIPSYFKKNDFCKNNVCEIQSNIHFVLSDFDEIRILDEQYLKSNVDEEINSVSLYDNIKATIRMLNNNITNKQKNEKNKLEEIYQEYYYNLDEQINNEHIRIVKKYMTEPKKYREKTIKLVEKFVYDYYIIINDVFK
jgi:hypothetical protein